MALEIPEDLIKRVQISLRREANLASYNPDDTSLPSLPSLQQTLSQLDPSPPYLRCKHCKARLLRGIQSLICVFCGRHHHLDPIPDPLVFRNTFACRWFLDSLDLDGSETVGPSIRANESNRRQNAAKDEFPLSDLLDLEIRWSAESEKVGTSYVLNETPIQGKNVLNLAEVDLDNFFDDGKRDVASSSSQALNKQIGSTESKDFQVSTNLNLFENVQPSETATRSMESKSGDSFSGWEANFQSANSETYREETKPFDPFMGSAGDVSARMGAVFGTGKDATDGKGDDNTLPSASTNNDLFQDDQWTNSSSGIIGQAERVEMTANFKDGVIAENANISSSMNVDWLQVDLLQSNNKKAPDVKTTKEDDDPFEAWNDFTSSTSAQDPFHGSLKQTVNKATPSAEQTSEINLFSSINNSQDIDFGSFSQQDLFSGADSNHYGSPKVHNNPSESFISDRMPNTNPTVEGDAEDVTKGGDVSSARTRSNAEDVTKGGDVSSARIGLSNLTQYVRYKKMAGKLGAKTRETPFLVAIPLFKPNPYSARSLKLSFCKYPFLNRSFSTVLTMAQPDLQNHSPEIKEPSLKIPKLGQNGVAAEISEDPISLLRVKKLSEKAVLPSRGSPLSAGYDLSSATETKVPARGKALVPTELSIAIPEGTYARVAPRSGLAWKHSIDVGAGVIDADYRGPVGVILFNHSDVDFEVKVGDRIAQLIIEKILTPDVIEVEDLDATVRGEGGFGSTGV